MEDFLAHGAPSEFLEQAQPGEAGVSYWEETREFLNDGVFRDLPRYLYVERREVDGYPGYKIYQDGRIWSGSQSGKFLVCTKRRGYLSVALYKYKATRRIAVHRLVAQAFIPNPENKPQVNHKRGIKTDNRDCELEWASRQENMRHAFDTGLMNLPVGEAHKNSKLTTKAVKDIILAINSDGSQREIAKTFGVSQALISYLKCGKSRWGDNLPEFKAHKYSGVGEGSRSSKLTNETATKAVALLKEGKMSQREIGLKLGVSNVVISLLKRGRTSWARDVEGFTPSASDGVGESHGMAKLNNKQVLEIKLALNNRSETGLSLSKKYGVSKALISRIKLGLAWSHLKLEE